MKTLYFVCSFVLVNSAIYPQDGKMFRSDYQYYLEADGWFKMHPMPINWQDARLICAYEGAVLASPINHGLASVMKTLATKNNINLYTQGFYTGIHATVSKGDFNSVDGVPLSEIQLDWVKGSPNNKGGLENCIIYNGEGKAADVECNRPFPYVCYKKHSDVAIMTECGTTDDEYKLDATTKKCYKFHRIGRPYWVAASICSGEGGHLAIINSDAEAQVLRNIFAQHPPATISVFYLDSIRLGFYNWNDESNYFGTLHGQSLKEAGYEKWALGQPNHRENGLPQRCGGMFRTALLDDTNCEDNLAFVCEKDPERLRPADIDVRFG